MGESADRLLRKLTDGTGFDSPYEEIRVLQAAAINERLQEQVGRIKFLAMRAAEARITEIRNLEDAVPLLLPHTAYKSYPESFLAEHKWDKLTRWLNNVSAYPTDDTDLSNISGIDDWVNRLGEAGHYVSCSSGTTGKSAMLVSSKVDIEFGKREIVQAYCWGAGVEAKQDARMFGLAPVAHVPKNTALGQALAGAFALPGIDHFRYPVPPITVSSITGMIVLRKAIAEGRALPAEIAQFEATSAERQKAMAGAIDIAATALVEARGEKLFLTGMWASLYPIALEVRNRGFSGKDFSAENMIYVGGGLKGAQLPPDYREVVYDTFNIRPERTFQMYGMQEIQSSMPRCREGGRYHLPAWLVCLPLDRDGSALLPVGQEEIEGRAAFFDLSMDGRWGGVISGDRISVDFRPCRCGARSPSIADTVARYSDPEGDDKIGCAGTVDAYVRGLT